MTERYVMLAAVAVAAGAPVALAQQGQPWWVVLLAFAGSAASAVIGWRGLSKPADAARLDALDADDKHRGSR